MSEKFPAAPPVVPPAKKPLGPWAVVGIVAGSGCLLLVLGGVVLAVVVAFVVKGEFEKVNAPYSVGESVRASTVARVQALAPEGYSATAITTRCTAINLDCVQPGGTSEYVSSSLAPASAQQACESLASLAFAASAPGIPPWAGGERRATPQEVAAVCVQQLRESGQAIVNVTMQTPEIQAAHEAYPQDFPAGVAVGYTLKRTAPTWTIAVYWS